MKSKFHEFKNLHIQNTPLLIGNVWNVQSATGFLTVKTGSLDEINHK